MTYPLGVLNVSTDAASPSATMLPFTVSDLLFWQDAGSFECALPNYAPSSELPLLAQVWIGGQELFVRANDAGVSKASPVSGPFADRTPYAFANDADAFFPLPLALGQSYSLFIPFTLSVFPAIAGGIFGHTDMTLNTDYLQTNIMPGGGLSVSHGAAISSSQYNRVASGAYNVDQVNLAVITFDAIGATVNSVSGVGAMTSYIYGMSGASLKLSPLATKVLSVSPKIQNAYSVGNIGGAAAAYLMDDFVAMNTAVNTQNPKLFKRMMLNYAAKYGLSTTP